MDIVTPLVTIIVTVFIAELTDKDALLILALATRVRPLIVFVSGLAAFTITTAIIVTIGQLLILIVPVAWITLAGAAIMIGYAIWSLSKARRKHARDRLEKEERELLSQASKRRFWSIVLGIVPLLVLLDLAGDATEILTIVFIAQFKNALLVFVGALTALASATAVETSVGNQLGKFLSKKRIELLSAIVFFVVGAAIIVLTVFR